MKFTYQGRAFLSNGLRFIACSPNSQTHTTAASKYLNDPQRGWIRFIRTITNQIIQRHREEEAACPLRPPNPPLKFRSTNTSHNPRSFLEAEERKRPSSTFDFHLLDQYSSSTLNLLKRSINNPNMVQRVSSYRSNYTRVDSSFLHRLMTDPTITIKPADKNLGMVIVDTTWYKQEMKQMLGQKKTYERITMPSTKKLKVNNKQVSFTLPHLAEHLQETLQSIIDNYGSTIENLYTYGDKIKTYLTSHVTPGNCVVPYIYLLIKVHKSSGLSGRPIVPSHSWMTASASVVVDHMLQDIVKQAEIPWLTIDTKSLINDLEQSPLPCTDGVFVTADIASLYTNIDTKMGLELVNAFLTERKVQLLQHCCIMELLTFVMNNSYLAYEDALYHQIDGTAMGTSCAPIYANIVVYMLERPIIEEFKKRKLYIYRRYLDDIYSNMDASIVSEFQHRMNTLHEKLKFEFVVSPTEASFLDLYIYKGNRFKDNGIVDLKCHQKKMNLYLYIPWHSAHPIAAKKSFIQTELMRYIRNSSDRAAYLNTKQQFFQRLRDRGYRIKFLEEIFNSIHYADRCYFLCSSSTLLAHPDLIRQPPLSLCLIKKIKRLRQERDRQIINTSALSPLSPPVFIIPYTPLSHLLPTRTLLTECWFYLNATIRCGIPKPIIAYQSMTSLMKMLVFQRARRMEKHRKSATVPRKHIQSSLSSFLLPKPAAHASQRSIQSVHSGHSTRNSQSSR